MSRMPGLSKKKPDSTFVGEFCFSQGTTYAGFSFQFFSYF